MSQRAKSTTRKNGSVDSDKTDAPNADGIPSRREGAAGIDSGPESESVLTLIQRIKERRVAPESLSAEDRRRCVELLRYEGYSVTESRMHEELFELLECLPDRPGARIAIAAPRGSAKSTLISLLFVLWAICRKSHRFIVILSDTKEKAEDFLDHVKHELHQNEALAADFPEVCEPGGQAGAFPRWRGNEIITHNGVKVMSLGVGQNIRGRRHIETRPDLFILDDVECHANTHSAEQRAKLSDWFNKSILKAGTKTTQVLVVGTIQHYDSLLAKLTDRVKSPFWDGRIYRSVIRWSQRPELWEQWSAILHNRLAFGGESGPHAAQSFFESNQIAMLEGTEALWPELEDYYTLMRMRESDGPASFDSEKQNEPVNPHDCFFLEAEFRYWDDRFATEAELLTALKGQSKIIGACDPSLGKQSVHADDSAIITLLRDTQSGNLYVLDADIARRKPDRIIDDILSYQRIRQYKNFGFESNCFQSFLASELRRRSNQQSLYLPVTEINHTSDKVGRIQSLQPLVRSGTLQFSRRHTPLPWRIQHRSTV